MIDIFIVGSARTGTSIILNYLCSNWHFVSFPESHYYSKYKGDFNKFKGSTHYEEICEFLSVENLKIITRLAL